MLTLTKIKNWAKYVPSNAKEAVRSFRDQLDFSYMSLNEDTHVYTSTKNPDIEWTSVTTYVKTFEPEEDWNAIAERWGSKHGVQTHIVRDMWAYNADCAAAAGSTCHLFGELICNIMIKELLGEPIAVELETFRLAFPFQLKGEVFLSCMISQDHIIEFWEQIIRDNDRWPVSAECIVDDPIAKICGTVDLIMLESDMQVSIWDYKTSKKLDNPFARSQKVHMLREYANMYNEPLSAYTIQLAQYKHMLYKHGIISQATNIIHVPNTEGSELKIVPVDTSKIAIML